MEIDSIQTFDITSRPCKIIPTVLSIRGMEWKIKKKKKHWRRARPFEIVVPDQGIYYYKPHKLKRAQIKIFHDSNVSL